MERIIGVNPNQSVLDKIKGIVKQYGLIQSVYDLTIHDYGFGRFVVSMRILGDYKERETLHTIADNISYQVYKQLNCSCTVQTDYLYDNESETEIVYQKIKQLVCSTDSKICMQNFRLTKTETHLNLVLDLIMPSALQNTGESLKEKIVHTFPEYQAMCNIILVHNHPMPIRI